MGTYETAGRRTSGGVASEGERSGPRRRRAPGGGSVRDRRRAQTRTWLYGLLASLALHLLFLLSGGRPPIPEPESAAAGPDADDDRAARGGMQAVNVSVPPSRPLRPPEVPLPVEVEIEPMEIDVGPAFDLVPLLAEPGLLGPPGLDDGDGEGDGGAEAAGRLRTFPPVPRMMIVPPANKDLRGTRFEVWVFVDEHGSVVADSTRLDPPTKDRGYNRQLLREAAGWTFLPARLASDGRPVAAWFSYIVTM